MKDEKEEEPAAEKKRLWVSLCDNEDPKAFPKSTCVSWPESDLLCDCAPAIHCQLLDKVFDIESRVTAFDNSEGYGTPLSWNTTRWADLSPLGRYGPGGSPLERAIHVSLKGGTGAPPPLLKITFYDSADVDHECDVQLDSKRTFESCKDLMIELANRFYPDIEIKDHRKQILIRGGDNSNKDNHKHAPLSWDAKIGTACRHYNLELVPPLPVGAGAGAGARLCEHT